MRYDWSEHDGMVPMEDDGDFVLAEDAYRAIERLREAAKPLVEALERIEVATDDKYIANTAWTALAAWKEGQ
jgi:hypothetical protein